MPYLLGAVALELPPGFGHAASRADLDEVPVVGLETSHKAVLTRVAAADDPHGLTHDTAAPAVALCVGRLNRRCKIIIGK